MRTPNLHFHSVRMPHLAWHRPHHPASPPPEWVEALVIALVLLFILTAAYLIIADRSAHLALFGPRILHYPG